MAFFDNQDHAGLALLLFAVLSIIAAIATIVIEVVEGEEVSIGNVIAGIGALVAGVLYLGFAQRVRGKSASDKVSSKVGLAGGAITDKFSIVVEFVHVFAIANILEGIFQFIGGVVDGNYANGIVTIILGIICLFIYKKITDDKETLFDKIVWIVLVLIFIFTILSGILLLLPIITIPLGLAMMIIGIFMLMAILDNDVKAKFGM